MKGQDIQTIAGRSLGKNSHHIAIAHGLANISHHAMGITAAAPFNVKSPGTGGQGAHHGPALNIGLGNKAAVSTGMHDHDVQPGNMVADQQGGSLLMRLPLGVQFNAPKLQQPLGPGLHRLLALGFRPSWKTHPHRPPAAQHMGRPAHQTPAGHQVAAHGVRLQFASKAICPPTSVMRTRPGSS